MPTVFLMKIETFSACAVSRLPSQCSGAPRPPSSRPSGLPREFDDEMAAAPLGRQQGFLDLVGNTLTRAG